MSEQLEELKRTATQLFQAEKWDEVISTLTEVIRLATNIEEKAMAYRTRGIAYHNSEKYDRAIEDYDKALKLDPVFASAYDSRGVTYSIKGEYDRAIEDYDRALELDPAFATTYINRGLTYNHQHKYNEAVADFLLAGELDPALKAASPPVYLATRIAGIFGTDAESQRNEACVLYMKLLAIINSIQRVQFCKNYEIESIQNTLCFKPQEDVAHYTSLHALKGLASEKRFRFYNTVYMNDTEEGRRFFEIMKNSGADVEDFFYRKTDQFYLSPAYVGSFVIVDPKNQSKDNLLLWRTYGKHDGQEATGACLIFKHDGTCFAERFEMQVGFMAQSWATKENVPELPPPTKLSLYKVSYANHENKRITIIPEEKKQDWGQENFQQQGNFQWREEEATSLPELAEQIKVIKKFNQRHPDKEEKQLDELACNLLDTIRFLFKSSDYQEEQEVRVVQFYGYNENELQTSKTKIKVDAEQIPPQFYLEAPESFRFSEVILGPQARGTLEWKRWIQHEQHHPEVEVRQSGIKYRSTS